MANLGNPPPSGTFLFQASGRTCLWLSVLAALLAAMGSVLGLLVPSIYAKLTPAFLPQAYAQDVANLAIAIPAMVVLAALSLRGSLRAYLLWLGVVIFMVYNYVIYAFSVPFGPVFFLWVAVLGLCLYALIGGIASARHEAIRLRFASPGRLRALAWVLMVACVLFALLWLSEDVPALIGGYTPASVADTGLPTNPVHVLDLAFFLPAGILTSVMILRGVPLGYTLAAPLVEFIILTGVPILLTPPVQAAIGQAPGWSVFLPIGTITVVLVVLLSWMLASVRPRE
jgi:hypothetical protein